MRLTPVEPVSFPPSFHPAQRCTVYGPDGRPIATINPRKRERVDLRTGERSKLTPPPWEAEPKRGAISLLHQKPRRVPMPEAKKARITGRDWRA